MAKDTSKNAQAFRREALIRELRRRQDPKWRTAACQDLKEFASDDAGADHLAAVIKAVLRSERWKR